MSPKITEVEEPIVAVERIGSAVPQPAFDNEPSYDALSKPARPADHPLPVVQMAERRTYRGAVVLVHERHSYVKATPPNLVEYDVYRLGRVSKADRKAYAPGGALVTEVHTAAAVRAPFCGVIVIDKPIRARALWGEHFLSTWKTIDEARDVIRAYVEEPDR